MLMSKRQTFLLSTSVYSHKDNLSNILGFAGCKISSQLFSSPELNTKIPKQNIHGVGKIVFLNLKPKRSLHGWISKFFCTINVFFFFSMLLPLRMRKSVKCDSLPTPPLYLGSTYGETRGPKKLGSTLFFTRRK